MERYDRIRHGLSAAAQAAVAAPLRRRAEGLLEVRDQVVWVLDTDGHANGVGADAGRCASLLGDR